MKWKSDAADGLVVRILNRDWDIHSSIRVGMNVKVELSWQQGRRIEVKVHLSQVLDE
jgi:hypothetical protein